MHYRYPFDYKFIDWNKLSRNEATTITHINELFLPNEYKILNLNAKCLESDIIIKQGLQIAV